MELIQVNPRGDGFVDTATGERFVPVGVNYAAMLDVVNYKGKARYVFERKPVTDWSTTSTAVKARMIRTSRPCSRFPSRATNASPTGTWATSTT